jgi:integrase
LAGRRDSAVFVRSCSGWGRINASRCWGDIGDPGDGQGGRHRATFNTKKANNVLTDIKSRIGKGEYLVSKLLPKFRELAEDWFLSRGDRRPGTVGNWCAQRVTMHSLNHSFASALIMAGAPVTEVQSRLGHSSPVVTLKIYSHWFKNVETDSVDRLAKGLTTGSKNLGHFLDTLELAPKANTA